MIQSYNACINNHNRSFHNFFLVDFILHSMRGTQATIKCQRTKFIFHLIKLSSANNFLPV